ncbi:MAG TPA: TonB-dependent receptor [Burkholderiaceae bacterium]|nr:TonB-dependent receptor [Burkholderiaceae bacterium]
MRSRRLKFRRKLPSPIQLAVMALFAGAQASQAQTAAADAIAQSAAAPAAAGPSEGAVQAAAQDTAEIIVTATKRATSLQDTPVAITAISASALEDAHVMTIQDVVHLAPSFQATTEGDHGVITMTLRGIGNDSAKTEYADPEVALFVDGIYSPRAEGAAVLLFDLSSIEVLRGPQGTLWGRNSTVGAVNMQTVKPVLNDSSGSFEGGVGTYNRMGIRGAFNVPLTDTMAMRLAFVHEQHDGYVDYQPAPHPSLASQQAAYNASSASAQVPFQPLNPNLFVQGGQRYNAQDQSAARLSLLWRPIGSLSWNVSYEYFLDRGTLDMNLLQDPRPGTGFWSALISVRPALDRTVHTVRSRVDYSINDDLNLAYIAGYSRFSGSSDFDQAGGATVPTSFTTGATYQEDRTNYSHYSNYSHELELQSAGKKTVDWILGVYYAAEDNGIRFDIPIFNGTQQGTVAWQGSFIQPKETVASTAGFGQATWNASDTLHLTGGLRYTYDDRRNEGGINWGWAYNSTVPQVPIDPGTTPGPPAFSASHNDGHFTGGKTTWLARANYDVTHEFLGYASVSTGYKSGGLQDGGRPYGSETLTNYEVGTKNTLLGGRVRFNNAAYYEDFKDFQFSAPVTNPDGTHTLATSNAEGAKVYGLESELAAKLTPDDKLQFSLALTHTRLGHLIAGSNDYALPKCVDPKISTCLDVTGHKLPHAPTFSAQLLYEHRVHLANGATLAPRASVHFETSSWLSVFNLGSPDEQSSYTRTDLGLRYNARKSWWVDGYVQNLENGRIKTNAQNGFGPWQSEYLPPLTIGMNVGIDF